MLKTGLILALLFVTGGRASAQLKSPPVLIDDRAWNLAVDAPRAVKKGGCGACVTGARCTCGTLCDCVAPAVATPVPFAVSSRAGTTPATTVQTAAPLSITYSVAAPATDRTLTSVPSAGLYGVTSGCANGSCSSGSTVSQSRGRFIRR